MSKIFQYQIEDRVFFADPVVAYRKLWQACPEMGKVIESLNRGLAKLAACEKDPTIPAYEKLEAEEDVEVAEEKMVAAFRVAFGHPWIISISADKAGEVFNVDHDTCVGVLTDFFVWTEQKKTDSGSNPTTPTGMESKS